MIVVSDASPLISLAAVGQLDLLQHLYGEVVIPVAVHVERHRQIGAILAQARQREQRTVTECATIAATTRHRYSLIERGEAVVGAAELEALMRFFNVPVHDIWPDLAPSTAPRQVVVQTQPGEWVQFVVQVQG